jgi:flotillin
MTTALIAVTAGAALVLLAVLAVITRIKVAGPNEAFIITGRKGRPVTNPETGVVSTDLSGQKIVMGSSVFVLPFVQKLSALDLSSRRLNVAIRGAVSSTGIKLDLEGVAIVKIAGSEDAIRAAGQRFRDAPPGTIEQSTQETLAGSLRSIVGRLTVEEIIKDRAAFASAVAEEAESSLTNQGLQLDTFQLQDIQAEGDYLTDLGRPESARVEKEAAIAEARARQAAEQERLLAEEAIAVAQRAFALKTAEIQAETDAAQARADAAGPLAAAARDQEVLAAQEQVAQRQAALKERELDTTVRRPADAERYRVEAAAEAAKNSAIANAEAQRQSTIANADAQRQATIAAAQAHAEQQRLTGEAELARRTATAQAVRLEGEAEAAATEARGAAEAQALDDKARAFAQFSEAAVLDLLVRVLPDVVREASAPLGNIEKLTVISSDGASDLTRTVASNVQQGMQMASDLTGVDVGQLLRRLGGVPAPAAAAPNGHGALTPGDELG